MGLIQIGKKHEKDGDIGVVTLSLEKAANWARKGSLWPMTFGLACCAIEMIAAVSSRYDVDRYGGRRVSRFSAPIRFDDRGGHGVPADGSGHSQNLRPDARNPNTSISMGSCATSGNIYDSYSVVQGVDRFVPVDIYVPGCPPTPEALFDGILKLQDQIMQKRVFTKQPEEVRPPGQGSSVNAPSCRDYPSPISRRVPESLKNGGVIWP